jgi:hypothetical protein
MLIEGRYWRDSAVLPRCHHGRSGGQTRQARAWFPLSLLRLFKFAIDPLVAKPLILIRKIEQFFPKLFIGYLSGKRSHFVSVVASLLSPDEIVFHARIPAGEVPYYPMPKWPQGSK